MNIKITASFWLIIGGIVLALTAGLLVVGQSGCEHQFIQVNGNNKGSPSLTASQDMETYTNSGLLFSIKYPKGWRVAEHRNDLVGFYEPQKSRWKGTVVSETRDASFNIRVLDNAQNLSLEEWLGAQYQDPTVEGRQDENVIINGSQAIKRIERLSPYHDLYLFVARKDEILQIHFNLPADKYMQGTELQDYIRTFDEIVKSLQFLE